MTLTKFKEKPRLVLILVVDQFRADFFTRLENKFLPEGTDKNPGGFQYLISKGAYFPSAEYKVMAAMTCPGHATISTGAYPALTGISLNDWYDRKLKKNVGCVEDEKDGVSPRRLLTSTIGDELKIISKDSKVFSMALKDRSAVMLGGHHANFAFWFGKKGWQTSTYYADETPKWVEELNKKIFENELKGKAESEFKEVYTTPAGIDWTVKLALETLKTQNLGADEATDILALSFSTHDMAGHKYGPLSPQVEAVTLAVDQGISKILQAIVNKSGSLKNVTIVLTGDHGIPPSVEQTQVAKIASGKLDGLEFYQKVGTALNKKFGKPSVEWIAAGNSLNYYINPDALAERKISKEIAEQEIKQVALGLDGVANVFTTTEFSSGVNMNPFYKQGIINQFNPLTEGDVVIIPQPFFMGKDENFVTHITGYSYDRYVPLVLVGNKIKPGVYSQSVEMIDLAPTLSFIMRQIPPAKSSGRVLHEIFN